MLYETEEQQVEAIKNWWKNNAASVFTGVLIGLLVVFGWRYWNDHRDMIAAEASELFEQLVISVNNGRNEIAVQQANTLRDNYKFTPYAAFADLVEARRLSEQNDIAGAKAALTRVVATAPDEAFAAIAILRLARFEISTKNFTEAAALLDQHPPAPAFKAEYAAARGDIARAKGKIAEARRAYQEALAGKVGQAELIQLKLDNLPPAT